MEHAPWWRQALDAVVGLPMTLLAILNFPVRSLSDRGREAIGAIAIVTLANASALLLYLILFG